MRGSDTPGGIIRCVSIVLERPLFLFDGDCGVCENGTASMRQRFEGMCRESLMPEDMKEGLIQLIGQRSQTLTP